MIRNIRKGARVVYIDLNERTPFYVWFGIALLAFIFCLLVLKGAVA